MKLTFLVSLPLGILITLQGRFITALNLPLPQDATETDGIDTAFAVDTSNIEQKDMAKNINIISGAVMGIAELLVGIKADVKLLRNELIMGKVNGKSQGRFHPENDPTPELLEFREKVKLQRARNNLELAGRLEKIFAIENSTVVDFAKEEIRKTIQINFIRVLATMLVNGPPNTMNRRDDILRLMKKVLNEEVDFMSVVEKLPFILRDEETNQFIHLIQTIKQDGFPLSGRQEDEDDGEDEDPQVAAVAPQETVILVSQPMPAATQSATQTVANNAPASTSATGTSGSLASSMSAMVAPTPVQTKIVVQQPQAQPQKQQGSQFSKVVEAVAGQVDVNSFLTNLPQLFEGVESIVDGVEGFIDLERKNARL